MARPPSSISTRRPTWWPSCPLENLVAIAKVPPFLEAALKMAFDKAAIGGLFTDLSGFPDPLARSDRQRHEARLLRRPVRPAGGAKTDMVALANDDEIVQDGARSTTSRRATSAPSSARTVAAWRHYRELTNRQLDPAIAADAFEGLAKAKDAKRIDFAYPAAKLPPGVKPVAGLPGLNQARSDHGDEMEMSLVGMSPVGWRPGRSKPWRGPAPTASAVQRSIALAPPNIPTPTAAMHTAFASAARIPTPTVAVPPTPKVPNIPIPTVALRTALPGWARRAHLSGRHDRLPAAGLSGTTDLSSTGRGTGLRGGLLRLRRGRWRGGRCGGRSCCGFGQYGGGDIRTSTPPALPHAPPALQ